MMLLSVLLIFVLLLMFPLIFGELMYVALTKLHISPTAALLLLAVIFAGGFVNIPIRSRRTQREIDIHPLAIYGLTHHLTWMTRRRMTTTIAINVGGCLVPTSLVVYETIRLAAGDPGVLLVTAFGTLVNVFICYTFARPVPQVGIVLPSLISPLFAAAFALLLVPDVAPPVAFVIGVVGPLIGADLLHLSEVERSEVGMVSIGGAGTFDGIVLSGIIAAYLA